MADRIVIVGGAMMGASLAWWLTEEGHPPGLVTVVERDPSYAACATAFSNSCIRQQFGNPLNVAISRFGVEVIRRFGAILGNDRVPPIHFHAFGYLYLAGSEVQAARLRDAHAVQRECGAATRLLSPDEIAAEWPFLDLSGVVLGSHGPRDEGYFDGTTMFQWWRRLAIERGVLFRHGEVTSVDARGGRVRGVGLACGTVLPAEVVVNAAGTRGAGVARLAGLDLPVEPRRRYTWIVRAERPLPKDLPLTIDPSGIHARTDGAHYMVGATPDPDPACDPDDLSGDWSLWEERVWPLLAARIPAFERLRVVNQWVGHYDFNTLDANAIVGPHPDLPGFHILNGFSGHGLQQAPALGRGLAELLVHGRYLTLDLSPLAPDRIGANRPFAELAVI
jgi:glycine/D-amino acid oxidase-like deaminating enzyme